MNLKMAYMSLNRAIPSRKANGVGVVKTCGQFTSNGMDLELILPPSLDNDAEIAGSKKDLWEFYGVPKNFRTTYLLWPSMYSVLRPPGFAVLAATYGVLKGTSLFYSRHIELACAAALYRRISVFESHNYGKVHKHPLLPFWIRLFRKPARRVAMVVTTEAGAKSYERRGVPRERILVARNGVDLERFNLSESKISLRRRLGLPTNKTIVGFSGHLYEGRGIEQLLECARLLEQPFFLIVGGETHDIERCKAVAQALGLSNVKFVGFVHQCEVPAYLLASDILVMPYTKATPSHEYMSPMKMFDYLASGRAIVATDFPVVREVLHDRQNAVIVPPGNGGDLASGIQWLLDHPKSAEKLGDRARRDAEQYSWENRVRRIVTWMREMFFEHAAQRQGIPTR